MKEITFTNIFTVGKKEMRFLELPDSMKAELANHARRKPLETVRNTEIRETA